MGLEVLGLREAEENQTQIVQHGFEHVLSALVFFLFSAMDKLWFSWCIKDTRNNNSWNLFVKGFLFLESSFLSCLVTAVHGHTTVILDRCLVFGSCIPTREERVCPFLITTMAY
mmetsp:Transcript_4156/g.7622  ORF Transcript_4156/g.7622 Transcript_4156/m.7622 type:complete len:114 (-) Transcript_4156:75-416(-)